MLRHTTRALTAVALSSAVSVGYAADTVEPGSHGSKSMTMVQAGPTSQRIIEFHEITSPGLGHPGGGRVVKGAPYCAEANHETVQWLPDGAGGTPNRITQRSISRLCRDGEGRTRQETERDGRKVVYLLDPGARENWVLDIEGKTARRLGQLDAGKLLEQTRALAERVRGSANSPGVAHAPAALTTPAPVVISSSSVSSDGARSQTETRVIRLTRDQVAAAGLPAPTGITLRAQSMAARGPGQVTSLGGRVIEGVQANGEITTWTIDAGKVGNEKAIVITREVWSSPELMITLSSREFDPRTGETSYRLKDIKRGEPDPTLMRVPADFNKTRVQQVPGLPSAGG